MLTSSKHKNFLDLDIPTFDVRDLHGMPVTLIVTEEDGCMLVSALYENKIYVIAMFDR